jgi:hypothetical protein
MGIQSLPSTGSGEIYRDLARLRNQTLWPLHLPPPLLLSGRPSMEKAIPESGCNLVLYQKEKSSIPLAQLS